MSVDTSAPERAHGMVSKMVGLMVARTVGSLARRMGGMSAKLIADRKGVEWV